VKLEGIQNFVFYHLDIIIIITLVVLDMSRSSYQENVEIKVIEKPLYASVFIQAVSSLDLCGLR
jgi:hypothetical protein